MFLGPHGAQHNAGPVKSGSFPGGTGGKEPAYQPTPIMLPGESLWTEEPGGLQSVGSQRVGRNRVTKHTDK